MKVYGVVTWFDPTTSYVDNLSTYLGQLAGIVVVDDSETPHADLLAAFPDVIYVKTLRNSGVAHALNLGYKRALEAGADWVLTMDQDSAWDAGELKRFLEAAAAIDADSRIALIAPNFSGSGMQVPRDGSVHPRECASAISAGSLVRLAAFELVGGYNEELFIDQVDHELGYRLRRRGLDIVRLQGVQMLHSVGDRRSVTVFGKTFASEGHSAARKYYMTRNALYMRKNFGDFPDRHLERIALLALGVVMLETDKLSKLWHIAKGVLHHFTGTSGKLAGRK